jgi:hypothetical protein
MAAFRRMHPLLGAGAGRQKASTGLDARQPDARRVGPRMFLSLLTPLIVLVLLPFAVASAQPTLHRARLIAGHRLTAGVSLVSPDGYYMALLQSDGNFVVDGDGNPIWATGTNGSAADALVMQTDGNLVLYAGDRPVWWTGTQPSSRDRLVMQNDGNLVIYSHHIPLWSIETGKIVTLGAPNSLCGGCGEVQPSDFSFGAADPHQRVDFFNVSWRGWDSPSASALVYALYTGPEEWALTNAIAFNLGYCGQHYGYTEAAYNTYGASQVWYVNLCTGASSPSS